MEVLHYFQSDLATLSKAMKHIRLHSILTNSSKLEFWQREGMFFYHHLRARGYPRQYLAAGFGTITRDQRAQILIHTTKRRARTPVYPSHYAETRDTLDPRQSSQVRLEEGRE
jgi:hypothetical protein